MTAQEFSQNRWKNRILIIQFDEANQENYLEQLRDLQAHRAGLDERKLIVYQFCGEQFRTGTDEKSEWEKADMAILRKIKKDANDNFSVTLMGLDGGVKLQQSGVLTTGELFEIIDAMPMRAREINRQ